MMNDCGNIGHCCKVQMTIFRRFTGLSICTFCIHRLGFGYLQILHPGFRSAKMSTRVKVVFRAQPLDKLVPTLIFGSLKHLLTVPFAALRQLDVPEETWKSALCSLNAGETIPLVLRNSVSALPARCSRHSAPARPVYVSRIVKQHSRDEDHGFVVVCEKKDLYATACAIGRAYPLFSRRSQGNGNGDAKNGATNGDVTAYVYIHLVTPVPSNQSGSPDEAPWQAPPAPLSSTSLSDEELCTLQEAVEAVRMAARIVDTPTNEMNVDHFLKEVTAVGQEFKIKPKIIRGEELNKQGFGGIYGVGKAASCPPALAILSWTPEGATETVAWVGKGIVYDTGGLSIKTKTGMPGMKRDCGGAAAILGAFQAVVRAGFSQNLHAIFCLAENSVGPLSTRPDDVHILYSGRSVEINNTDAEGRLVLADGVAYAQKDLKADIILDMATLTGAQGIAVGKYHAAVLSNSEDWQEATCLSARTSGDMAFPVPYAPELHFSEFASAIADMKNSVADRNNAQVSCAGLFVGAQLGWDFPGIWVHVDMAAPSYCSERATGYGVALLSVLFGDRTKRDLLKALAPGIKSPAVSSSPPAKKARHS